MKSQISIFVIIGLLIVIITGLVVYKINQERDIDVNPLISDEEKVKPVVEFVDECLKETTLEAIYTLGEQGLIYPRVYLASEKTKIAYYYFKGSNRFPSINLIEQEIAQYIRENIQSCVAEFKEPGMAVEDSLTYAETNIEIFEESVSVKLDYPMKVFISGETIHISEFTTMVDTTFMEMYNVADIIITRTISNPDFINLDFIDDYDFDIRLIKVDKATLIYEISDTEGLDHDILKYRFGVKYG